MTPSHDDLEAELVLLLNELADVQTELLEVLRSKCQFMATHDLEQLTEIQPHVAMLTDRLQGCHDRRGELLARAGARGLKVGTLEELVKRVDPKRPELRREMREAAGRMRLLRHHSLTNWVLAQRSLLHVAQLLEIIATGGRLQPTYSTEERSACSGALVDSEA